MKRGKQKSIYRGFLTLLHSKKSRIFAGTKKITSLSVVFILLIGIFFAVPALFFSEKAKAAISLRSSTTNSSVPCNSGLTINKPSGVTVGDVMIAQIASDSGNISTPTGWALIDSGAYHSNTMHLATFFRIIEGGEGSSFSFTVGSSNACMGGIMAFEGVDNGQIVDNNGAARTTNSGTGTTVTGASITNIVSANTVIVVSMFKATGAASANFSTVSGMTEQYDFGGTSGAIATDYVSQAGTGATGAKTSTISSDNWVAHMVALKPATIHMMLLWDSSCGGCSSAPAGWSYVTAAEGYYLRGDSAANYGVTGGHASHIHDNPSVSMSAPSALTAANLLSTNPGSTPTHTHALPSTSIGSASNEPAGYRLRLIRFNSGVPNIIPAKAIALFDGDPGMPTDGHWTQVTTANSRVIKVDSGVGNGSGFDTHTHSITWGSIGNAGGQQVDTCVILNLGCSAGNAAASPTHSHASPGTTTSAAATAIPPYFQPILGQVDQATPTLSLGLTAMFDGEPGGGWIVKSDSGGDYYHRFIRPNTTFGLPTNPANLCEAPYGCVGHKTLNSTAVSGPAVGSVAQSTSGTSAAKAGHTHTFTASWPDYTSDSHYIGDNEYFLPPYFSIVIAEKVNFILDTYRWYEDPQPNVSGSEVVGSSNEWSVLNVPANNPILTLPVAYNPPVSGTELRLRVKIVVNNNNLAAGEMQFKLQYKEGTDGNCVTGVWTDVDAAGGGGIWRYASSTISDGTPLTTSVLSSTVLQRYAKSSSPGTNPNSVTAGFSMEWDFHIEDNGAAGAKQYSFRLAEDTGILLSEYAACPTLSTKPEIENQLRHGNFFESETERGFSWAD